MNHLLSEESADIVKTDDDDVTDAENDFSTDWDLLFSEFEDDLANDLFGITRGEVTIH